MTTETLTPPVASTDTPATTDAPATAGTNTLSLIGLVLSLLSIVFAMSPLAIVGIVLGFLGYRDEPTARTTSTWAIVLGFVSLFGWVLIGLLALGVSLPFLYGAWATGWL